MKMHEIKGKFNTAKVFAKTMDEVSAQQIKTLCDQAFSAGSKIRIMPDVYAGAGRLFSRAEARRRFNMEEYKNTMEGGYTTSVNEDTLDECPMAYKDMAEIMQNIVPTVDVVKIIRPIYNFKAAETAVFGKSRNKEDEK